MLNFECVRDENFIRQKRDVKLLTVEFMSTEFRKEGSYKISSHRYIFEAIRFT